MKLLFKYKKCFKIEKVFRSEKFKRLDSSDVNYFKSVLKDDNQIEYDEGNKSGYLDLYNTDWIKKYKGNSSLVLKPKRIEEVSAILSYCNEKSLAIVPQSGNTGLVGGSVPVFDEIIVSMVKMNRIIGFKQEDNSVEAEAGCVLQDINEYVGQFGRVMPLDLGAKGSCLIGGNLATNAGGIHFIKFGSLRHTCKSLTAVLPSGEVVHFSNDDGDKFSGSLKQLFIGSEGTLGVIVKCEMTTGELFKDKTLSIIGLDKFEQVIDLCMKAKEHFKDTLTAIEFFDNLCLEMVTKNLNLPQLFPKKFGFYLLVESSMKSIKEEGGENEIDTDSFNMTADFLTSNDLDDKCILSNDQHKSSDLWEYREKISSACGKKGIVFKYDVSLPLTVFYKLVEDIRKRIGEKAVTVGYGHVGDYNLHLNVCYNKFAFDQSFYEIENLLEPYIFDYLKDINGSISAEHGIGVAKATFLNKSQSENNIQLMKRIKAALDPNGIMNPYKLLPY